jgi:hypothetical protein
VHQVGTTPQFTPLGRAAHLLVRFLGLKFVFELSFLSKSGKEGVSRSCLGCVRTIAMDLQPHAEDALYFGQSAHELHLPPLLSDLTAAALLRCCPNIMSFRFVF